MEKHQVVAQTDDTHIIGCYSHAVCRSARMDGHMDKPAVRPLWSSGRIGGGIHIWCHGRHIRGNSRHDVHPAHHEAGLDTCPYDSPVSCLANGMCREQEDWIVILEDGSNTPRDGSHLRPHSQRLIARYAWEVYLSRRRG